MTAKERKAVKERKAELEALDRVVAGMGRHTREELVARLEAYAREEEDPPYIWLRPGRGSVFATKEEVQSYYESIGKPNPYLQG